MQWTTRDFRVVKGMLGPFLRWSGGLGLSVGSLQGTQSSFHLWYERWACIRPLQGNLYFFLIRASRGQFRLKHKHRVPLTYIFLREKSSWSACGKMAYLFSRRQGISSHFQTIWGARIFHPVALLKLLFLQTWDGCLRESLDCCKGCQATCCIWCGMQDGYGFNEEEMCFILSWFGVHHLFCIPELTSVFFSSCDMCSLGFSSVPSGKSRFLTSLLGIVELLSMKSRGIGPHLAAKGKSQEFSRVAAGTWCIFKSYGGDGHLKLGFVQRSQDSCLVMTDTSGS